MTAFSLIRPYFIENRHHIAVGLVFLLGVDALLLFVPRVVKHAVDSISMGTATPLLLGKDALIIVGFSICIGLFRYGWRLTLIGTSRRVEMGLRNTFFSHLLTLDARYYDNTSTGDLMSHATSDINNIRMATGMGIVTLTDAVMLGSAAIGFMAWIHPGLTLMSLIPMPLIVLSTRFFGKKMHARHKKVQEGLSEITEHVREAVDGIRVVKVFGKGEQVDKRLSRLSVEYLRRNLRLVRVTGALMPLMIFLSGTGTAIVVGMGGRLVISNAISPGDFVAFISYLGLLTWPMMALGWMTNLVQRGKASLDRLVVIFEAVPHVTEPENPVALPAPRGEITVSNLSFSFDGSRDVLTDINLTLSPGATLGIVGPPGSGKTALCSLLARLYDPNTGDIQLDRVPLTRIATKQLRQAVHFMPQEPLLFSGTISENICGTERVPDAKALEWAIHASALKETIDEFDGGVETIVGEKGVMLSGGQKQRVALARTLYTPAPLLILDDPISQVDTRTARHILGALFTQRSGTMVVASHRFAAIHPCHEILVMDSGHIAARGTHEELLKTSDYYRNTWQLQSIQMQVEEASGGLAGG